MGSAPQKATSHRLRSNPSRSAGAMRRTHSSKAKLGPPLMVPPSRVSVSSHKRGRLRNSSGDISAVWKPWYSGTRMPPMSPMSW